MNRKARLRERQNGRNLLSICLDVHMTSTGAYERSVKDNNEDVEILYEALDIWEENTKFTEKFDEVVKSLIEITLEEHEIEVAVEGR